MKALLKILYILLLVVLLSMTIGCDNQDDSVGASSNNIEARLSKLEEGLAALEEKVSGGLYDNPWGTQSIEARLKALEDKLGVDENPWAVNPWANP